MEKRSLASPSGGMPDSYGVSFTGVGRIRMVRWETAIIKIAFTSTNPSRRSIGRYVRSLGFRLREKIHLLGWNEIILRFRVVQRTGASAVWSSQGRQEGVGLGAKRPI